MRLALFDFDGTLTTRDTFVPFLRHVFGSARLLQGLAASSGPLLAYAAGRIANDVAKECVIAHFLQGRQVEDLRAAGSTFATDKLPALLRPQMLEALRAHRDAGDTCALVSASLDLYLEPWARAHRFDAVLCSRLAEDADGRVTGRLEPRNCHGAEKARRIAEWLAGRVPTHITAYGDSRGDHEMLALAHTAHWIGPKARAPSRAASCTGPAAH